MAIRNRGTRDPFAPDSQKSPRKPSAAQKRPIKSVAGERLVFRGFGDPEFLFFHELDAEQDREWFAANKARYESLWVEPIRALMQTVQAKLATTFPNAVDREIKVFRIQRDLRFTVDRTPYKTNISALLPLDTDLKRRDAGMGTGLYVQFGLESIIAIGQWMMSPDALESYRRAVADDKTGAQFAKLIDRATRHGVRLNSAESLKRVPKGFDADHPRAELLKRKGLALSFEAPTAAQLASPALVDWMVGNVKRVAPVIDWLEAATARRGKSKR